MLADLIGTFGGLMHLRIDPLDEDAFNWRPDPGGNTIAHTVWHVSRWMDVLAVFVLQGRPHEDEQWFARGWRDRYGYDPRGIGHEGFGVITGYTLDEVNAIPRMDKAGVVAYFDQTIAAFREQISSMTDESLQLAAPGGPGGRVAYQWIKAILTGELGHVGEIEALVAMRARAGQSST
jgi:hypothetical protein